MKIGIIGTRGIPNLYGGFEQFAEQFSIRMVAYGHEVVVYCSKKHRYQSDHYKGVTLIHCFDPEYLIGSAGQFIYDFNCIKNSRNQQFDIILQLGYTSSSIWSWLYPSPAILATNMDGLEWKRSKYNRFTRRFLRRAEKWAVRNSDYLIADSLGIQQYLLDKFSADSVFIPYGADIYEPFPADIMLLEPYNLRSGQYDLLIARFEPENNIETILKAYKTFEKRILVLVGNYNGTRFGKRMFKEYGKIAHIHFTGAVFDSKILNVLRCHSRLYLHGHSVGGTNPSLLEAMASNAMICANNNIFNRAILGDDAYYFDSEKDLRTLIGRDISESEFTHFTKHNKQKIKLAYNWEIITRQTEAVFEQWASAKKY